MMGNDYWMRKDDHRLWCRFMHLDSSGASSTTPETSLGWKTETVVKADELVQTDCVQYEASFILT